VIADTGWHPVICSTSALLPVGGPSSCSGVVLRHRGSLLSPPAYRFHPLSPGAADEPNVGRHGEVRGVTRQREARTGLPGPDAATRVIRTPVGRVASATCGVSRSRGTSSAAEYAVASELPLKADLSLLVTDPVPAESLRLRAFPFQRGGFCRSMELLLA